MCQKEKIKSFTFLSKEQKHNLHNEAMAFYELAECGQKYIPEQKHIESYIPYIVNMTFCAELLLKLLLISEGKSVEEAENLSHNLKRLYNKLSPEAKGQIYSSFKRPMIYNIDEELDQIKKAFVDWRYLVLEKAKGNHKKMQVHPLFLKEFNEILLMQPYM